MKEKIVNIMTLGFPLEQRREMAVDAVRLLRKQMSRMTESELAFRQKAVGKNDDVLKKIDNEEARLKVTALFQELENNMNTGAEKIFQATWDGSLDFLRSVYGNEATDYALEVTKGENPGS